MYRPWPPKRCSMSARNDSPCDCSCSDRPPYESITGGAGAGSASTRSMVVATLKKLSARKKKPSRGRGTDLTSRQMRMELRMRCPRREPEIDASALGVEAPCGRDRVQQGRLAAAVLADDERDVPVKIEAAERAHRRDVERVHVATRHGLLALERDRAEVRPPRRHGVERSARLNPGFRPRQA